MARRLVLPRPSDSESMGMGPAEHRSRDTEQIGLWWIGSKQGCGNHPTGHPCRNNRNEWVVYVIYVAERWRAGQMFLPVVGNTTPRRSIRSGKMATAGTAEIQSAWPLVVGLHRSALHTAVSARGTQFLTATLPKPRVWGLSHISRISATAPASLRLCDFAITPS
ncbi:uncharacterized protein CCOS01_12295 [Colletotrichum costaricense]|uniref:Uncharacterized protein n=1 Tax=Colletotrichum costaricense TaxID=1209916 RepID=A0AAI9YNX8_9PEZI|nr:uncharacterized protein CCOS01_12295 [Colletotrichum costaricense]KAK1518038.1 hypothetical protein CCOS01_12295 [Colletotrichum costaricense]